LISERENSTENERGKGLRKVYILRRPVIKGVLAGTV